MSFTRILVLSIVLIDVSTGNVMWKFPVGSDGLDTSRPSVIDVK